MRITATVVALVTSVLLTSGAEARMGFEDNKLNFKSCDGKNLTARWRENKFHLSVPGKTLDPSAPKLEYLGWDGKCRSVHRDGKGRLAHTGEGASEPNYLINYLSWDGTKWSATPAGTGFFNVFVAGKDAEVSKAELEDAARWLSAHKPGSRAAERLASELTSTSDM
jgi:hypothetical protein